MQKIFRVIDMCTLEYPNGNIRARRGELVAVDMEHPVHQDMMRGRWHMVREFTPQEGVVVQLRPIDWRYQKQIEAWNAKHAVAPQPEPEPEPEPGPEPAIAALDRPPVHRMIESPTAHKGNGARRATTFPA